MNTGRALIWLPTTRHEKYRAKQAIDTFFVRFGDVLATALVAGAAFFELGPSTLAMVNAGLTVVWLLVAARVASRNEAMSHAHERVHAPLSEAA
jgi:AAA family ATP:ADP antiporter